MSHFAYFSVKKGRPPMSKLGTLKKYIVETDKQANVKFKIIIKNLFIYKFYLTFTNICFIMYKNLQRLEVIL